MRDEIMLSICIPTYNRAAFLKEGLEYLLPQMREKEEVEVVVIDNASTDTTPAVIEEFRQKYPRLRYDRNISNTGYSGSQLKCFEMAQGTYVALLCDDDVYKGGEVAEILRVIKDNEYAFIALNYYDFYNDPRQPYEKNFAPEKDVVFPRGYDIMNYPSVGHFSGFVFNKRLAMEMLEKMLKKKEMAEFEKHRGFITELAVRVTAQSSLPTYFIGARKLAARIPKNADYDILRHLCLEYYEFYYQFYREGLITEEDLAYREKLVLARLPRAIIRDLPCMSSGEIEEIVEKFQRYFNKSARFCSVSLPLLKWGSFAPVRFAYRFLGLLMLWKREVLRALSL